MTGSALAGGGHVRWPSPGRSDGHHRAELMTATGQFLMSLDRQARRGTGALAASVAVRAAGSVAPCAFHGHRCGGVRRGLGEVRRGSGGTSEPGRDFPGPGGFRGSPRDLYHSFLLLPFRSQSRAVVFPTSPSLLVEGVRSGTRRRRGPSTSPLAAGGTGPGRLRTVPAHGRTGLVRSACGHYPASVRCAGGRAGPSRACSGLLAAARGLR